MKEKVRAAAYEMAGVYLLVLTFQIFRDRMQSTGAEFILLMVGMVLFGLFGIGLLWIGYRVFRGNIKRKESERIEEPRD